MGAGRAADLPLDPKTCINLLLPFVAVGHVITPRTAFLMRYLDRLRSLILTHCSSRLNPLIKCLVGFVRRAGVFHGLGCRSNGYCWQALARSEHFDTGLAENFDINGAHPCCLQYPV